MLKTAAKKILTFIFILLILILGASYLSSLGQHNHSTTVSTVN